MKILAYILLCTFILKAEISLSQEKIRVLKYEELEDLIATASHEKTLVLNFWATTCVPCVKELPHFMSVNKKYSQNPKYKMILVSLDRLKDMELVEKFIKEKPIDAEVVLLDDNKRMNTWIPRFDAQWGGELPVTIFYKNTKKVYFHQGEMSEEELNNTLIKYLN